MSQLFDFYITIKYRLNLDKLNITETVEFPYWTLFYTLTSVTIIVTLIVGIVEMHALEREYLKQRQAVRAESTNMPLCDNNSPSSHPHSCNSNLAGTQC